MSERLTCAPSQTTRFEVLVRQIMKTLCLDRNAALAMAAEMVVWELIFAARITTATPESAQSVA